MITQTSPKQKLADWELAFNSIKSLQNNEALKSLIDGLRSQIGAETPGVA